MVFLLVAFLFQPCLGKEEFCEKRYNEISYLVTHNAMSSSQDRWIFPNQNKGLLDQLEDGVRGLSWDIHYHNEMVYLCHGYCWLGKRKLTVDLGILRGWLEQNPREVVSIFFESYVNKDDVKRSFEDAGLIRYLHYQPPGEEWPKIFEMIDSNKRVIVFTSRGGGVSDWYHDGWEYMWDTSFSYKSVEDFSCMRGRGTKKKFSL